MPGPPFDPPGPPPHTEPSDYPKGFFETSLTDGDTVMLHASDVSQVISKRGVTRLHIQNARLATYEDYPDIIQKIKNALS